jgi:regulator of RNase E activity RraA
MDAIAALGQYKSGTIQDFLDLRGLFHRCLGPEYRMLVKPSRGSIVGRVKTIAAEPLAAPETQGRTTEGAVAVMKKYESHVTPGDVVVMGPRTHAPFPPFEWIGGFIASLFHGCGAVGLVTPYVRDLEQIEPLGIGVVAQGTHPAIIRYRIKGVGIGDPVCIGGVEAKTGDIVVSDSDGTVVLPDDAALLGELLEQLARHAELEQKAWEDRARGDLVSAVFARYGAL